MRKNVNMLSGPIAPGLLHLSVPIMVLNLIQSLFNTIDMTILKTYDIGNGTAVGAVGVCGTLITLITGLVIGISTGASVTVAKSIGRGDPEGVERSISSAMAFSLVSGAGLALIGISCAKLFLRWVNCPDGLLDQATLYFKLYFAGVPISMVYNFCVVILRASGDSNRPTAFAIIGGITKVIFTYIFVAMFQMDVRGVGLATIVSSSTSLFLCLWILIRSKSVVRIRISKIRFYKTEVYQILHIGVPAGLQRSMYAVANVFISAAVNTFGQEATTGVSIANNFDGILYQLCNATAAALTPYVSQNVGGGNIKRVVKSVSTAIMITACIGVFFGSLSALFSRQLSSLMSSDPVAIEYSRQKMIIISTTYFICGINDIFASALRGMGRPIPSTVSALVYFCGLRFAWVYFVFPLIPNLTFLYLCWPVSWLMSILTLLPIFVSTAKNLQRTHSARLAGS